MKDHIIVENEFMKASEIKKAKKALSDLTGCPEILINVEVQGMFKIPNKSMWTNELNLDYGWYKVIKIGDKYLSIHVLSEGKTFKAEVDISYVRQFNRKPSFRLIADVYNNLSFRR